MTAASPPEPDLLTIAFALLAERGWAGLSLMALAERAERAADRGLPAAAGPARDPAGVERAGRSGDARGRPGRARGSAAARQAVRADHAAARRAGAVSGGSRPARAAMPGATLASCCRSPVASTARCAGCRSWPGCARTACAPGCSGAPCWRSICGRCAPGSADDSGDLAKTMAELDSLLRRVERMAGLREPPAETGPDTGPQGEATQPA